MPFCHHSLTQGAAQPERSGDISHDGVGGSGCQSEERSVREVAVAHVLETAVGRAEVVALPADPCQPHAAKEVRPAR